MIELAFGGSRGAEEFVMVLCSTGGSGRWAGTVGMPCALVPSSWGGNMSSDPPAAAMEFVLLYVDVVAKKLSCDGFDNRGTMLF